MKDFKIGKFTLEQKRGSDLVVAVGDIQNTSANRLPAPPRCMWTCSTPTAAKIDTVSDEVAELLPDKTWHFISPVKDPRAKSVRFASLKEMQ